MAKLLLDSNLLLVLLVGTFDRSLLGKHKRVREYALQDLELLSEVAGDRRLITTRSVLTEVSNLAGQIGEPLRTRLFKFLARALSGLSETHTELRIVTASGGFVRLGLTDAEIEELAIADGLRVLTADLSLFLRLQERGIEAVNFNHVRTFGWT